MPQSIRTRRKNAFNLYKEAKKLQSFDEFPMLRPEVDPQLHVSCNNVDQPFHLTCEKDTVLMQSSGSSRVEFVDGPVRYFNLHRGDFVYVPAGLAHRVKTLSHGILIRYKARKPGTETSLWYCVDCQTELFRHEFNADDFPAQQGYQDACAQYNADEAHRRCPSCDALHPPVDLSPFRWSAIAQRLSEPEEE